MTDAMPRNPTSWRHQRTCRAEAGGRGGSRNETLFHWRTNSCHHARSEWNPRLSCIRAEEWEGSFTACNRSNMRRRNDLPECTTLQAWLRCPTRDSCSFCMEDLRSPHSCRRPRRRDSFSGGRQSWPAIVSMSIPRKMIHVAGPSHLWATKGTPRVLHSLSTMVSASMCLGIPR